MVEWSRPWPEVTALVADIGFLRLIVVGADADVPSWEVGRKGRREADFDGGHIVCGECATVAAAKAAAEQAARELLIDALVAMGHGDARGRAK